MSTVGPMFSDWQRLISINHAHQIPEVMSSVRADRKRGSTSSHLPRAHVKHYGCFMNLKQAFGPRAYVRRWLFPNGSYFTFATKLLIKASPRYTGGSMTHLYAEGAAGSGRGQSEPRMALSAFGPGSQLL